jgi:hypothetical protein
MRFGPGCAGARRFRDDRYRVRTARARGHAVEPRLLRSHGKQPPPIEVHSGSKPLGEEDYRNDMRVFASRGRLSSLVVLTTVDAERLRWTRVRIVDAANSR